MRLEASMITDQRGVRVGRVGKNEPRMKIPVRSSGSDEHGECGSRSGLTSVHDPRWLDLTHYERGQAQKLEGDVSAYHLCRTQPTLTFRRHGTGDHGRCDPAAGRTGR